VPSVARDLELCANAMLDRVLRMPAAEKMLWSCSIRENDRASNDAPRNARGEVVIAQVSTSPRACLYRRASGRDVRNQRVTGIARRGKAREPGRDGSAGIGRPVFCFVSER